MSRPTSRPGWFATGWPPWRSSGAEVSTCWSATRRHGGRARSLRYAVSKDGLVQLTRQVAVEHGRDGILCNAVAPGKIVTGTPGDLSGDAESAAYARERTPFARLGDPDDVAAAVGLLACGEAPTSAA